MIPENLKYSKSHEWVEFLEGNKARIGLTDHAQQEMGGLVFINLPEVGDKIDPGQSLGDVESVKTVSEVFAPVGGRVSATNESLEDQPEKVNENPYETWLVELSDVEMGEALLDAQAYEEFCKEEA